MTYVMPPPPEYSAPAVMPPPPEYAPVAAPVVIRKLRLETPRVFKPLFQPSRYKGAYGGRGSGKSHIFAEQLVENCQYERGNQAVCIREVQKTLAQSSKKLVEMKIQALGLGSGFRVFNDKIETPGDGIIIFQGMQDHTAESIKSLQGFKIAWIDEAQAFSARSLALLRPTIREDNSEIWASWNPTRKKDAIDDFFRGPLGLPKGAVCVRANWSENPFWNATLEAERLLELERYPDRYDHTYEGGYAKAFEGAYFAGMLAQAKLKGRIGVVEADPLLPLRAFIDIGGAGAKADAFVIWIVQFVGQQIRVLDYYEAVGQVLGTHIAWLRKNGYEDALLYLPHDGVAVNNITGKRYATHLEDAGFKVETIPNQGPGAAAMRIEAVRRLSAKYWFNDKTTEPGREALGFYHEKKDEHRNIGLGPEHDWSSHGSDAFGLMAVAYEDPSRTGDFNRTIKYPGQGYA
jgi:phage terminase large subunit